MYKDNPEKDQDRVNDTLELFDKYGSVLFQQNFAVYANLNKTIPKGVSILEAGSGNGVGACLLSGDHPIVGSDKLERNVNFAKLMHPNIFFDVWDLNSGPYKHKYDYVIAVETVEHVQNWQGAILNLVKSANKEVYFSTPNRNDPTMSQNYPNNPYHVHEAMTEEILEVLKEYKVRILHWDTFKELPIGTQTTPVVYHVCLN